jgi:hypothetical protein
MVWLNTEMSQQAGLRFFWMLDEIKKLISTKMFVNCHPIARFSQYWNYLIIETWISHCLIHFHLDPFGLKGCWTKDNNEPIAFLQSLMNVLGKVAAGHVPRSIPCHDVMIPESLNKRVNKSHVLRSITYEYASMSDCHSLTLICGKPTHFRSASPKILAG